MRSPIIRTVFHRLIVNHGIENERKNDGMTEYTNCRKKKGSKGLRKKFNIYIIV